jgi:SAM-dependent methyltransferase
MNASFAPADVSAYEHTTWSRCAPGYEEGFAQLTREGVQPLLAAAGVAPDVRVLDVGTGTGIVAQAALDHGASAVGIDFSDAMLVEARRRHPAIEFLSATADALPFDGESFDVVVANVTLHHLARPLDALRETHRVLRRSGRIACTVWDALESLEAFGLFFAAVEEHAEAAKLPHGPLFGVAEHDVLGGLLADAGFVDVTIEEIPAVWRMPSVDVLLRALGTWAQLDALPAALRARIEASVRSGAVRYQADGVLAIPNPMLLIAASKQ